MKKSAADLLNAHLATISEACERFDVQTLGLFGSGATGSFEPGSSDLDFLVTFKPEAARRAFDNFFGLSERLEEILGRKVDLVTAQSIRNPYLRREVEQSLVPVYAANTTEVVG
ncbi:MAG: hypothetical protein F9K44_01240 [Hyphomicrobiaceae bacterium]|nr:MAG: hypothetical protein F9K44_01240 [Hyphomicrobiaceae bacterium]